MGFHDFMQSITSPELRNVAGHWDEARGSRAMPSWSAIRPGQITAQLPSIWVYKYDRKADLFTGRLAGHLIEHIFGKSFRGTPMTEIYAPADYPRLFERAKRVTWEPAFYRGAGMVFRHVDRLGRGERIMMPLADDGVLGDGILGATVYETIWGKAADDVPEHEFWFPL